MVAVLSAFRWIAAAGGPHRQLALDQPHDAVDVLGADLQPGLQALVGARERFGAGAREAARYRRRRDLVDRRDVGQVEPIEVVETQEVLQLGR